MIPETRQRSAKRHRGLSSGQGGSILEERGGPEAAERGKTSTNNVKTAMTIYFAEGINFL